MRVSNLITNYGFELITDTDSTVEINGVYSSDLLSFVMANGNSGNAWITVQAHLNILAVASLMEFSCIILPYGVQIDNEVVKKANEENINILKTELDHHDIYKIFIDEEEHESIL